MLNKKIVELFVYLNPMYMSIHALGCIVENVCEASISCGMKLEMMTFYILSHIFVYENGIQVQSISIV